MTIDPLASPITEIIVPLDHLRRLTDCCGIIQHADHAVPRYHTGYATDDNARALMAAVKHYRLHHDAVSRELATRYLAFLTYAQREDGRFHNFFGYDRRPLDIVGSEDTLGRALQALALLLHSPPYAGLVGAAERLFNCALPALKQLQHPRSKALGLLALHQWVQARPEQAGRAGRLAAPLADYLVTRFEEHSRDEWCWILPDMTYANGVLPEALFRAHQLTGQPRYLQVARESLDFFCQVSFRDGLLSPVGNDGWYHAEDKEPPLYDQQPIDAAAMVEAALAGFEVTGEEQYLRIAQDSLAWFFGRNLSGESLYDPETGGCYDALTARGVNLNRGAESTICLLLAQLSLRETLLRRRVGERNSVAVGVEQVPGEGQPSFSSAGAAEAACLGRRG